MAIRLKFMILKAAEKMAARHSLPFRFALLDLPNELIVTILEHIDSRISLRHMSRTCRRMQKLTEPVLYRSALIRTGSETDKLVTALQARPARAAALHRLDIPCHQRYVQSFEGIAHLMEQASNLKELMIESPSCNSSDFEDEEAWEDMVRELFRPFQIAVDAATAITPSKPLQKLHTLVLHLNGSASPYWTVDSRSLSLFLLPGLQCLKISCVNILSHSFTAADRGSFTSLKHLELDESNITHQGLMGILALPRALETLYLGENCHNVKHFADDIPPASNHLFQANASATLAALAQQKDSLTTLTYLTSDVYYHGNLRWTMVPNLHPVDAGFSDFQKLESITLVGHCPNFERAVMSSRSPPHLKRLSFKGDNAFCMPNSAAQVPPTAFDMDPLHMTPFLRAPSSSVPPNLHELNVTYQNPSLRARDLTLGMRDFISTAAKATRQMGIRLKVHSLERQAYFPPYLYGEPLPKELLVFDGSCAEEFAAVPTTGSATRPP